MSEAEYDTGPFCRHYGRRATGLPMLGRDRRMRITAEFLDQLEALARKARPEMNHRWERAAGDVVDAYPQLISVYKCDCGLVRGRRRDAESVHRYARDGEILRDNFGRPITRATVSPCVARVAMLADVALALVGAARAGLCPYCNSVGRVCACERDPD